MKTIILTFGIIFLCFNLHALTLKQAINLALKYNPAINKTAIDINIQQKRTNQIKASSFGKIDAIAMYNQYDSERVMQPLLRNHLSKDIFSIGVQYNVPIFTGFELTENIKISELNQKMNMISNKLTKNEIIFNIKSVYYKILSLNKQLIAMKNYKRSLDKLYENVNLMVKTGKKPEVDLYKINYDLKSVEATISQIENSIDTLKFSLKQLIGKDDLKIDKVADIKFTKNFKPLKKELNNLASVKQVITKNKIANENIIKSKADYYPKLYLSANTFENYGSGDVNIWQITLNLKFNIFDFGVKKNKVEEAKLEKNKIKFEKKELRLRKQKEIADAINRIKTENANITAYKNQVKFAKESERIEKMKYEEGVSQIYDYLYAKSRRYLAESKYFDSLYLKESAIAYYYYVTEKYAK